ncbi:DUF1761 domain-containing protein [Aurantiacibacter sp. MUD11]|uniref:DUF1761 domain-containing protein n=1 Tax=Aurantiacibacter sp. MUD11 TaxID=3003265 RepID=UPI0022AA640E|nr:DUF1761 domain-containing protein [Aurantiacibacter sp. MUD11]WAT19183.1 DUF1761 domain-containing protein [Aurantiacibacter sp. MUD11]
MGDINLLAVLLGSVAFFLIGAVWYGPLFGKTWMGLTGVNEETVKQPGRNPTWLIMLLCFLFEMLVVTMLGHSVARSSGQPHIVMMMAVGFAATIMAPAIGINYLYQMKPGKLFAIDAGYFIVGMAAAGGVFILMG